MFSIYKGLILFILIANTLALPVKRDGSEDKMVVFEKIRTVLNCVCYYEEGQSLDSDKVDEYCDCTPEKTESDRSLIKESEVNDLKKGKEENLGDVQKYGSADAAFFANLEENEAKEDQANEEQTSTEDEKTDNEVADENETNEEIPENDSIDDEIISNGNEKYIFGGLDPIINDDENDEIGGFDNARYLVDNSGKADTEAEDIYDEEGNIVHVQVELIGEAYEAENNEEDDENDEFGPTIIKDGNSRYIINSNGDEEFDDEEEIDFGDDYEEVNDENDEETGEFSEEVLRYRKKNQLNMVNINDGVDNDEANEDEANEDENNEDENNEDENDEDENNESSYDHINDDDDLRTIYKKLVVKKLKSDIKNMDSEKLIVNIIKEALKGKESSENPLKEILN